MRFNLSSIYGNSRFRVQTCDHYQWIWKRVNHAEFSTPKRTTVKAEEPDQRVDANVVWLTWWNWSSMTNPLFSLSLWGSHGLVLLELNSFQHANTGTWAELEQEEPGGLLFSTQANKVSLWLPCFSKIMQVNGGNRETSVLTEQFFLL